MKKAVLRDEYVAPSRAELKAFIDEEFNGKEANERKANISIENAKSGRYEARDYEYLDGSVIHLEAKEAIKRDEIKGHLFNSNINSADKCVKYEGIIYERENVLSREDLINENDDIKMMHHAGKFDGFNGGNGKIIEVIERKAKALEDINVDNVKSIEVDECISNGKWNGKLVSQEKYDEIMNEEGIVELMQRMFIKKIELIDNNGNKYEKIVRRVFEDYDAGALAKLLNKKYNGVNVNWGRKVKEVIYVGGLRKEILVRKALRSKVFVNGGFISERHDIDLKRGGILVKGESGCKIKVDKKSKIIYASKGRNDLGRYDYEKVMH